jgi:hypothetical protein
LTITQRLNKLDTSSQRKKAVDQHLEKIQKVKNELQNCIHELENLEGSSNETNPDYIGNLYLRRNGLKNKLEFLEFQDIFEYEEMEISRSVKAIQGKTVCMRLMPGKDQNIEDGQLVTFTWFPELDIKEKRESKPANCTIHGEPLGIFQDEEKPISESEKNAPKIMDAILPVFFPAAARKVKTLGNYSSSTQIDPVVRVHDQPLLVRSPTADNMQIDWVFGKHSDGVKLENAERTASIAIKKHNWVIGNRAFDSGVFCWEVVSELNDNQWVMYGVIFGIPDNSYSYYSEGSFGVSSSSQKYLAGTETELDPGIFDVKSGQVVRVRLDCTRWKLTVKNIDNNMVMEMDLIQGQAYYPHFNLYHANNKITVRPIPKSSF